MTICTCSPSSVRLYTLRGTADRSTEERVHIHEIEEVTRVKELERHKHSVHYHVQKLSDVQHLEPIHHHSQAPTTEVHVRHSNEAVDLDKFAQLNIDQSKLITAAYQDRAAEEGGVAHENNSTLTMQPVIVREIYVRAPSPASSTLICCSTTTTTTRRNPTPLPSSRPSPRPPCTNARLGTSKYPSFAGRD